MSLLFEDNIEARGKESKLAWLLLSIILVVRQLGKYMQAMLRNTRFGDCKWISGISLLKRLLVSMIWILFHSFLSGLLGCDTRGITLSRMYESQVIRKQ